MSFCRDLWATFTVSFKRVLFAVLYIIFFILFSHFHFAGESFGWVLARIASMSHGRRVWFWATG